MIFPSAGGELDLPALAEAYAYPRERWLRANFVSSADGAAYVDGRSGGLSSAGDKRIFGVLRVLADVVLVGAGTARVEEYKPARRRPSLASLRAGRPETATIALVTRTRRPEPGLSPVHRGAAGRADRRDHLRGVGRRAARRGRQGRRRDRRRR